MQLTSVQGFRMWWLNIFICHIEKVLCGVSSWTHFSPSFIWNMFTCQSSPPLFPPKKSALGTWKWNEGLSSSELCRDCRGIWIIHLNCERSTYDSSSARLLPHFSKSKRANQQAALMLCSFRCYFSGRPSAETRPMTVTCDPWMVTQNEN